MGGYKEALLKSILTAGRYFRKKFGKNVRKVPISISGFTCPNIDGKVARGGCTFCENESFSPNFHKEDSIRFKLTHESDNPYLDAQLQELYKQFYETSGLLKQQAQAEKFLVYFQSFTNTYAPLETLKILYAEALKLPDVVGLSIGTRADSVQDELLPYLRELSQNKEIWLEYGLQSIHDQTLEKINRAETFESTKAQVMKTKEMGINLCIHIIFGLPGEDQTMMLETMEEVSQWGVDSIKIHPLYVVKNTQLAKQYEKGEFAPISEEVYIDTVVKSLQILPENTMVQRITAGINDETLISPQWCRDKNALMLKIRDSLLDKSVRY